MRRLFPILFILLILPCAAVAQRFYEDTIHLKNVPPSRIVEKIEILTGGGAGAGQAQLIPDDANKVLKLRIPDRTSDALEVERHYLTIRDVITQMDQPEPTVQLDLYLVQTNLLSDDEFRTLDANLRQGPLALKRGTTAKGVVFHQQLEVPNQQFVHIDEEQAEARAMTRPEPVRLTGRILPSARPDGGIYLLADFKATAIDRPFAEGKSEIVLQDRAAPGPRQPLVIASGEERPMETGARLTFPPRHEVMLYVWAQPKK